MILQIEIKLLKQPRLGDAFGFTFRVNGVAVLEVSKTFGPAATDVIAIGANVNATAINVLTNLAANDALSGLSYSVTGTSVFATLTLAGDIATTGLYGTLDYVSVYEHDLVSMAPFEIHNFAIEIIDLYENDRTLVEEFSAADSLHLSYEGGEDLYAAMMPSKIEFSMRVPGEVDGGFLHILTGDENRFLVKLKNIDAEGNAMLLWQGFILPDLYSEPYDSGVLFVKFTAIDMMASLKTKYLKPWYYYQMFNLPELFALLLSFTGLSQELYVKPALVNVSLGEAYQWRNIFLSLEQYTDGKDHDNLYDILESVLKAQGFVLYSFRGKWFLDGLTRRQETEGVVEVYHPDGIFKESVVLTHQVLNPMFSKEMPELTAETPWKKVSLEFETDSNENLYPEDIVVQDYHTTEYYFADDRNDLDVGYADTYNVYWKKIGAPYIRFPYPDVPYLSIRRNTSLPAASYNVTEAAAMVNYVECNYKPYAQAGRRYELEMEFQVLHILENLQNQEWMSDKLGEGYFNKLVVFRVIIGGVEMVSNRPSFPLSSLFVFKKEILGSVSNAAYNVLYTLKWEFTAPVSGPVEFRFLPPLGEILDYNILNFWISPQILKMNVVGDIEDLESVVAVRDINYTLELSDSMDVTCTVDSTVSNSFGISTRISDRFANLPALPETLWQYQYFPSIIPEYEYMPIRLDMQRFTVGVFYQDLIFRAGKNEWVFLKQADGNEVHFFSLYTKTIDGVRYIAAYNGYDAPFGGRPNLPENYVPLPLIEAGDAVMIMLSLFYPEDNNKRALWKIYGFDDDTANSYLKTLAYAMHAVRPDVCYSIDCTALDLVFPTQLVLFRYLDADRLFIPTRITMDLFRGKTQLTMKEAKLETLTDISYE